MFTVRTRNVNGAVPLGVRMLQDYGVRMMSRYGPVVELPEPLTTHYEHPCERVLFSRHRDANPFLHLFESLWILAGRNDVAFLRQFAKRMAEFSDDGVTYHGAYGRRLRAYGGDDFDQLDTVIRMLREDPTNRRIVASIWNPDQDLWMQSKDLPCNDMLKFEARHGALNLIVFNRSNDLVWGAYGANAVQFSVILEYVAAMAALPVGYYEQVSCNFHAYDATIGQAEGDDHRDLYAEGVAGVFPLVGDPPTFDEDLAHFMQVISNPLLEPHQYFLTGTDGNPFFRLIALPMFKAHRCYKNQRWEQAAAFLSTLPLGIDWRFATQQWLAKRIANKEAQNA